MGLCMEETFKLGLRQRSVLDDIGMLLRSGDKRTSRQLWNICLFLAFFVVVVVLVWFQMKISPANP